MTEQATAKIYKYFLPRFSLSARILRFQCVDETKCFVTIVDDYGPERRKKNNLVHDTWESAHAELLRLAEMEVKNAALDLQRAQDLANEIAYMKKPEEFNG